MRRILPALLAVALLLPATGCAFLRNLVTGGFERPEVSFRKITAKNWSLDGVDLGLVFQVKNPNDVALEVARVDYQLEVEGNRVARGSPNQGVRLPANATRNLTFPARVRWLDVLPAVTALFTKDTLAWRASGKLGIETPIGILDYPLSRSGRVQVPDPRTFR